MFPEMLMFLSETVFGQRICCGCKSEKSKSAILEEREQQIKILVANKERTKAEDKKLSEEIERVFSQLQRQMDFVVFPLLKLHRVVLLDIAQKLQREHRRHLMQSCSTFRDLLYRTKAKHLDCRIVAEIACSFREQGNDLRLTIEASERKTFRTYQTHVWTIAAAATELPEDVVQIVKQLMANFDCEMVPISCCHLTDNASSHPAIACFLVNVPPLCPSSTVNVRSLQEMFPEMLKFLRETVFGKRKFRDSKSGKSKSAVLEEREKRIRILVAKRGRTMAEEKMLSEEIERVFSKLQRQMDFVVFPLLKLPAVVLLEIAKNLKRDHRRHLMHSCSSFRGLLFGKKAEHLDCRIVADMSCTFREQGNDLILHIYVVERRTYRIYQKYEWTIAAAATELPNDVVDVVKYLMENFDSGMVAIRFGELSDNVSSHAAIAWFLLTVLPLCPSSCLELRNMQAVQVLLGSPASIAFALPHLSRASIRDNMYFRADRLELLTLIREEAIQGRIDMHYDLSVPETEMRMSVVVSSENVKTLTVYG